MNTTVLMACDRRSLGISDGRVVAIHCRDCSRIASGRTIKVHVYHRWLVTVAGLRPIEDAEVAADGAWEDALGVDDVIK